MNLRRLISLTPFLSDATRLQWYPPFWMMRIKVTFLSADWRSIRIKLPQTWVSKNHGGGIFGGFQASLADPIAAIACSKVFPNYSVWTRNLKIDFLHEANSDITLHFDFDSKMETKIQRDLGQKGRSTPTFTMHYKRGDGKVCTTIHNTVAIRQKGYKKPTKSDIRKSVI